MRHVHDTPDYDSMHHTYLYNIKHDIKLHGILHRISVSSLPTCRRAPAPPGGRGAALSRVYGSPRRPPEGKGGRRGGAALGAPPPAVRLGAEPRPSRRSGRERSETVGAVAVTGPEPRRPHPAHRESCASASGDFLQRHGRAEAARHTCAAGPAATPPRWRARTVRRAKNCTMRRRRGDHVTLTVLCASLSENFAIDVTVTAPYRDSTQTARHLASVRSALQPCTAGPRAVALPLPPLAACPPML